MAAVRKAPSASRLEKRANRDEKMAEHGVKNVWKRTFVEDFTNMLALAEDLRTMVVGMDTEFPGDVVSMEQNDPQLDGLAPADLEYEHIRLNTDQTDVLQIGLSFGDYWGNPVTNPDGFHTYQFNFKCDLTDKTKPYNSNAVKFLRDKHQASISFNELFEQGIDTDDFAAVIKGSMKRLVGNVKLQWILFQGGRDLAYLIKAILGEMPARRENFLEVANEFFPSLTDLKTVMKFQSGEEFGLRQIGQRLMVAPPLQLYEHNAGFDASHTLAVYLAAVKALHPTGTKAVERAEGEIYYLGNIHAPYNPLTYTWRTYIFTKWADVEIAPITSSDEDKSPEGSPQTQPETTRQPEPSQETSESYPTGEMATNFSTGLPRPLTPMFPPGLPRPPSLPTVSGMLPPPLMSLSISLPPATMTRLTGVSIPVMTRLPTRLPRPVMIHPIGLPRPMIHPTRLPRPMIHPTRLPRPMTTFQIGSLQPTMIPPIGQPETPDPVCPSKLPQLPVNGQPQQTDPYPSTPVNHDDGSGARPKVRPVGPRKTQFTPPSTPDRPDPPIEGSAQIRSNLIVTSEVEGLKQIKLYLVPDFIPCQMDERSGNGDDEGDDDDDNDGEFEINNIGKVSVIFERSTDATKSGSDALSSDSKGHEPKATDISTSHYKTEAANTVPPHRGGALSATHRGKSTNRGRTSGTSSTSIGRTSGTSSTSLGRHSGSSSTSIGRNSGIPTSSRDRNAGTPTSFRDRNAGTPTSSRGRNSSAPTHPRGRNAGTPTSSRDRNAGIPTSSRGRNASAPTHPRDRNAGTPTSSRGRNAGTPTSSRGRNADTSPSYNNGSADPSPYEPTDDDFPTLGSATKQPMK